jgi:hypothetical protein
MISFKCDSCGKDISDKVFSSVRQFYGKSYFEENVSEQVMEDYNKHFPDFNYGVQHERDGVYLEVKLFYEFLKMIHAFAWDVSPTCMFCSNCAMKHADEKKKKVVTIFTKIEDRPYNN